MWCVAMVSLSAWATSSVEIFEMQTVIPSNNSHLQHALARLTEEELASLDFRVITRSKNADDCDEKWLPFLAWECSIADAEGWQFAENETAQRNLIRNYIEIHQGKGTPAVIRQLFRDLQLGEIDIVERASSQFYNGMMLFDGVYEFGADNNEGWAKYGVILKRVITVEQSVVVRLILNEIAPLRCELLFLDYRSEALLWNGEIQFDGNYTFGAINNG